MAALVDLRPRQPGSDDSSGARRIPSPYGNPANRSAMYRAWSMAAVMVATVVAGCLEQDPDKTPDDISSTIKFSVPVVPQDHPDGFGSEPSILVASDGSIYVTSILGTTSKRGDGLWKSADTGVTWTYLGMPDYPYGGGDADIDEDGDGTLYLTGMWRPASLPVYVTGGQSVATSNDGGETWNLMPLASMTPVTDRQWLITIGDDTALLFYIGAAGLMFTRSINDGVAWTTPVPVAGSHGSIAGMYGPVGVGSRGMPGDPVLAPDGTLYIPYGPGPGGGTFQSVYVSRDQGLTFEESVIATPPNGVLYGALFSAAAVDSAGVVYVAWAVREGGGTHIEYAYSDDGAASWSEPTRVTPEGVTAVFPWVTAGDEGRIAISYYRATGDFAGERAPADTKWFAATSVSTDANTADASFINALISDNPAHKGPLCTTGAACSNKIRKLGDFFETALLPDGRIIASWADDLPGARVNKVAVQTLGNLLAD